eukprot:CAMPEP_0206480988 /NCGR_PEP_ID=MMETSP0324_2-20121206/37812_1 /ASSEMBLY_ACC=CAM_ASM_000836 /TAXON_ID=2866 /ORGANISM="Crypthecodinium cohnii, Strain Seligo" /LENGTH=253 /DNA_ID=CAMNT_0053958261 /DNA_START=51 /DNA_END=809 /DNA_ORIENTATION=+
MIEEESDEASRMTTVVVSVLHILLITWGVRSCAGSCCGRRRDEFVEKATATPAELQPRKRVFTAYAFWGVGGLVGIHHIYLDRLVHGLAAMWTLNFLGFGFLLDGLLMGYYVRRFNMRCADWAPYDSSRRSLCCRLPLLIFFGLALILVTVISLPRVLHNFKYIDIDRLAAQTEANPYETLQIDGSASLSDVKAAYKTQSLKWHPDRNPGCGKECENRMAEITKAYDLVKRRKAPLPEDRSFAQWLSNIGSDW